jgi:hypothetical protein
MDTIDYLGLESLGKTAKPELPQGGQKQAASCVFLTGEESGWWRARQRYIPRSTQHFPH